MNKDEIAAKLSQMSELASELAPYFDNLRLKATSKGITARPLRASLHVSLILAQVTNHIELLQMANDVSEDEILDEVEIETRLKS